MRVHLKEGRQRWNGPASPQGGQADPRVLRIWGVETRGWCESWPDSQTQCHLLTRWRGEGKGLSVFSEQESVFSFFLFTSVLQRLWVPGPQYPSKWKQVKTRICEIVAVWAVLHQDQLFVLQNDSLLAGIEMRRWAWGLWFCQIHWDSWNFMERWQGFPKPNANRCLTFNSSSGPKICKCMKENPDL